MDRCHPRVRTTAYFIAMILHTFCLTTIASPSQPDDKLEDSHAPNTSTQLSPRTPGAARSRSRYSRHTTEPRSRASTGLAPTTLRARAQAAARQTQRTACCSYYSGIHYDAVVLAPAPDAPQEFCASVVPAGASVEGGRVVDALSALAAKLRAKRAYTNIATFDLKCEVHVQSFSLLFALRYVDAWTCIVFS